MAGFQQLRHTPRVEEQGWGEFGHRFGVFYARRSAQSTGELLAGYLDREDPRPHLSMQHGFWNRTKAAFESVAVTSNEDGSGRRPALAPIAGAFGSGMVGMALYRNHNSLEDGFRRTGISYSTYFASALAREFQPDIAGFATRLIHKKKQD
jgi:hypothetical protein